MFKQEPQIDVINRYLSTLGPDQTILKEIFFGEHEKVINNIAKYNEKEVEIEDKEKSYPQRIALLCSKHLIMQFQKMENWSIDHEQLWKALKELSKRISLNIHKIYKEILLEKIEDGVLYITILETLSPSHSMQNPNIFNRGEGIQDGKFLEKLKQAYNIINNENCKKESSEYKRFSSLNPENMLKYELLIIKYFINSHNMASRYRSRPNQSRAYNPGITNQMEQTCQYNADKFYSMVPNVEYQWFLLHLLEIRSEKSFQLKKYILSLRLQMKEQNEKNVITLVPQNGVTFEISPKSLTKKIIEKCLEDQSPLLMNKDSLLVDQKAIYLKYDLSKEISLLLDSIFPQKICKIIHQNSNTRNMRPQFLEELKAILKDRLEHTYTLIRQIIQGKNIYLYESQNKFSEYPEDLLIKVLEFGLEYLGEVVRTGNKIKQMIPLIEEVLITEDLIIIFSQIFNYIITKDSKVIKQTFQSICQLILKLVLRNEEKMQIMNSPKFIESLILIISKIVEDKELKGLPHTMDKFFIHYIPTLFIFGLDIERLPLKRIFQLKIAGNNESRYESQGVHMSHNNLSNPRHMVFHEKEDSNISGFIEAFPSSITYFTEKLIENIQTFSTEIAAVNIFQIKKSSKILEFFKLSGNDKIKVPEEFTQKISQLILTYPSYFILHQEIINWPKIKKDTKLNIPEQIIKHVQILEQSLNQTLLVDTMQVKQLCQGVSSNNEELITFINRLNKLNILLKMRDDSDRCDYLKSLVNITLKLQEIESVSLNRIVDYQGTYSLLKVKEIREIYKTIGDRNTLHFKIYQFTSLIVETCWSYFSKLNIEYTNILLKEYKVYINKIASSQDKNLILKLLKKTYRHFGEISRQKGIGLNYQLYNHNKDEIYNLLSKLYKQYCLINEERDTVVMGESYLKFIEKCIQKNKNPAESFNKIIYPHINESLIDTIEFVFFQRNANQVLLGNKLYCGNGNVEMVLKSVFYDFKKKILERFSIDDIKFYESIVNIKSIIAGQRHHEPLTQEIKEINVQVPYEDLQILKDSDRNEKYAALYEQYIEKLIEYRYSKSHLPEIRSIFLTISDILKKKHNKKQPQLKFLQIIIKQMSENNQNAIIDENIFKSQCFWIQKILQSEDIKSEQFFNEQFIKRYLKFEVNILNNPQQNKDILMNSLKILQRLIPHEIKNDEHEILYAKGIFDIIYKILLLRDNKGVVRIINSKIITKILLSIIKSGVHTFYPQMEKFFNLIKEDQLQFGHLLCQMIQKEGKLISMEADIKGYFFKESQNLVDQSQDKISTKLQRFIHVFKDKYQEELITFSNLVSKFVKKINKKENNKEKVYLTYDKSNRYDYSQISKIKFIDFQPEIMIKNIIKNLMKGVTGGKTQDLRYILQSFKVLIYYYPVILPYLMLHPLENTQIVFFDHLINQISNKRHDFIREFIFYTCLDHSCMLNLNNRSIFFSEYLCYKILKHISQLGLNKHNLSFIYEMNQLKRFSYACKLNIGKEDHNLVNLLLEYLKQNKEGFHFKSAQNNIIYLILSVIYKQDHIDNLKKCFIPKKIKESSDNVYRLIDDCLIPFNVYFRKKDEDNVLEKREANIAYTGTVITPFYPEIYEKIIMDNEYPHLKLNFNSQIIQPQQQFLFSLQTCFSSFSMSYLQTKDISNKTYRYANNINYLMSGYNDQHKRMIDKIKEVYLKNEEEVEVVEKQEAQPRNRHGINFSNNNAGMNRPMLGNNIFLRQENRIRATMVPIHPRSREERERFRQQRPVRVQPSRFAQEDFNTELSPSKKQNKQLLKEFQESLSIIPSQEQIQEKVQDFSDIKTNQTQLQIILNEINDKLFLMNRECLNMKQIKNKSFLQKKEYLELKDMQVDFDFNKQYLNQQDFQQYCLMKAVKFQRLTGERREEVRVIEENMLLMNLVRTRSSDSIEYIIETIDENYQLIPNIKRTLSQSQSISSYEQDKQKESLEGYHYESNSLSLRAFSDVKEELIYEMILQNYYVGQYFMCKQLMPFLENKKIQNLIINTVLFLIRNPLNSGVFPDCLFKFEPAKLTWTKKESNPNNDSGQVQFFCDRLLMVFESVKNYSFYQNDNFLLQEISTEGIMGLHYDPKYKIQGKEGIYVPIFEILGYILESKSRISVLDLMKGVKQLPNVLMDQLFKKLNEFSQKQKENQLTQEHHASNIFHRPNTKLRRPTYTFSYENLSELFKNQEFQAKFKQAYPFGTKQPCLSLLTHLLDYNIYTKDQLITLHLNILTNGPKSWSDISFANKVIKIYSDQQLQEATWISEYQEALLKIVGHLGLIGVKLEEEPISRIFKLTSRMGFEMKKILYKRDLQKMRRNNQSGEPQAFEFERNQVISKKAKGYFNSAFEDLRLKPDAFWRSHFSIRFIGQNGARQSGFGDGVRRQWFTLLSKSMVNLDTALFIRTPNNYYHFNKESQINPRHLQYFEFIGKLFGYSLLRKQIFISPSFSTIIYKMILGQKITTDDIIKEFQEGSYIDMLRRMLKQAKSNEAFIDSEMTFTYRDKRLISHKNYQILKKGSKKLYLKQKEGDKKGKIESEYVSYKVNKQLQEKKEEQQKLPEEVDVFNIYEIIELKPGGAQIQVNFDNMHEYVQLYEEKMYELLVNSISKQFEAFLSGLKGIVHPKYLTRFNAKELRLLIEGTTQISVADLKQYTRDDTDKISSGWLWQVLQEINDEEKLLFVWNWTGVDKMPAEGAKIMSLRIYNTSCTNIIAHTCSKGLQIPHCKSLQEMRTKVTIVINNIKTGQALIED